MFRKGLVVVIIVLFVGASIAYTTTAKVPVKSITSNGLPPSFDWRDINGVDYTTPIKNQAPAPSCEAYAFCAVLETMMQYQMQEIYTPDLSETHLFFYAGGSYAAGGVSVTGAANYLKAYGVPDEGCNPDPHRAFDYTFQSLPGWENRTVKIQAWGWVNNDVGSIKQALIEYGPLLITIHVWKDFDYYHGGVYKHRWGRTVGGHVVAIVGYNDTDQCWIVKNSWGTKWGEAGWFRMSYDAGMISAWGQGTGVMYLDGVYGNLKPDVPKVYIETPKFSHTYILGREFQTIFKKLPIELAAARILGNLTVKVTAENTNNVEFFLDNVSQYIDDEAPFTWELQATHGLHTLEVRATNDYNTSIDFEDIYVW